MFERRYSLAKFSVNLETKTIEIAETFSEALNSVAGVAIPVDVRERYADAVQGYTRGTISVVSTMSSDRGPLLRGENVGEHCRPVYGGGTARGGGGGDKEPPRRPDVR